MPAKTRFSVALDDDEYETLANVAEKYRISMAWLVRQAVADFLERYRHNETQLPLPLAGTRLEQRNS
ncbi:MAG: ribbon-helix-helix domain-containing protein [Rhodospirillaceae bacterium]|nr:ribbon-helix-helix domain-containing protein [Rhodospirillaceae bacterium]